MGLGKGNRERMKVIVVDDEIPIRDEIRTMCLAEYGYEIIGEAANGRTALQLCRQLQPDIVITDITMPVMDGLELIRILQRTMPLTKYVLLTCHQDFAYASEAIRHGALDYIIKADISQEGILRFLDRARSIIERERENLRKLENEQRNSFSRYALKNVWDAGEIDRELERIHFRIHYNGPNYFLVVENRLGSWAFMEMMISSTLEADKSIECWVLLADGLYGVSVSKEMDMEELMPYIRQRLRDSFEFLEEPFRIYAVKSHGKVLNGKQYMEEGRKLDRWKAQAFYEPGGICFDDSQIGEFGFRSAAHIEQIDALVAKREGEEALCRDVVRFGQDARLWPEELKKLLFLWLSKYISKLPEEAREIEGVLCEACDIRQLAQSFAKQCERHVSFSRRSEVRRAIRILQTEYQTDLTLAGIAERIGINAQYLGRMFTEETNEKFSDCLNRIRMERANELLQDGKLKIYEVAEQVGISNYRYFTQKFREWSGVSPKEVRKRGK